ncbi:hypothetical protein BJ165DRAFT_1610433 [Panaeolus papilionaceus]|nr:hypothetical protein BJ165DRAFT_1610433 [Panaeolus papilionaceus]
MSLVRVIFTSLNGLSLEALYNEHSPSSFLSAGFASAHHLRRRDGTYHLPVSILVSSGYFTTEVAFLCSEDVWHDVCFGRDWHSLCLEATACTEIPLSSGHSLCVQHSQATTVQPSSPSLSHPLADACPSTPQSSTATVVASQEYLHTPTLSSHTVYSNSMFLPKTNTPVQPLSLEFILKSLERAPRSVISPSSYGL